MIITQENLLNSKNIEVSETVLSLVEDNRITQTITVRSFFFTWKGSRIETELLLQNEEVSTIIISDM